MTKRILFWSLVVGALGVGGCKKEAPSAASAPASKAPAPEAARAQRRAAWHHKLALAPSSGDPAVDGIVGKRQALAKAQPKKVDPWIRLGYAWVRKARASGKPDFYDNARGCARIALALEKDNPLARDLIGLTLLNAHRFADARDMARATLAKHPKSSMSLGILGDALLELGDYDGADAAVAKMIATKPNLPSYSRRSHLAWLRGATDDAKKYIKLAFDSGRGQRDREPASWTLVEAAMIFWHEGDYGGALTGLDMALEYYPGYPHALVAKARALLSQGKGKEAAPLLTQALKKQPHAETAWLLGDAHEAAGDAEAARRAFARAVEIGKRSDPLALARFWATKDRETKAALALAEEQVAARGSIQSHDAHAWALYRAKRFAEARAASDRARRLKTPDATLLYHAGAIRVAQGRVAEGRALVARALKLNPGFDRTGAAEARALLAAGSAPKGGAR